MQGHSRKDSSKVCKEVQGRQAVYNANNQGEQTVADDENVCLWRNSLCMKKNIMDILRVLNLRLWTLEDR